jgi:hypothetical protein
VPLNVAAEWVLARGAGLWGYASWHPVVPIVNAGVLAVVEPIVLLPLSFSSLARWKSKSAMTERQAGPSA